MGQVYFTHRRSIYQLSLLVSRANAAVLLLLRNLFILTPNNRLFHFLFHRAFTIFGLIHEFLFVSAYEVLAVGGGAAAVIGGVA